MTDFLSRCCTVHCSSMLLDCFVWHSTVLFVRGRYVCSFPSKQTYYAVQTGSLYPKTRQEHNCASLSLNGNETQCSWALLCSLPTWVLISKENLSRKPWSSSAWCHLLYCCLLDLYQKTSWNLFSVLHGKWFSSLLVQWMMPSFHLEIVNIRQIQITETEVGKLTK